MYRRQFVISLPALAASFSPALLRAIENQVRFSSDDNYFYITSNGLPNHQTGNFPNSGNPHSISEQNHSFRIPRNPQMASRFSEVGLNYFGVAVNGVPFDPATAEFWQGNRAWNYDALAGHLGINLGLDRNNAHVQPNGMYHYHGLPLGLLESLPSNGHGPLAGFAADGFPIYALRGYTNALYSASGSRELKSSYRLRQGQRPGGSPGGNHDGRFTADFLFVQGVGDLDAANGRRCVTPDYPAGTYAYFLTRDWPVVPRLWRGVPDASFQKGRTEGPFDAGGGWAPPPPVMEGRRPPPPRRRR